MNQVARFSGIVLSLAYLITTSFWKTMPVQVEWVFCIVLLASLGIPHGAADHLVAEQIAFRSKKHFKIATFIVKYLCVMLIYGTFWYFSPFIAFIIFIGISVFHFGDLETTQTPKSNISGTSYFLSLAQAFVLGIGILGFILRQHASEVLYILQYFNLGVKIPLNVLPIEFFLICILIGYQKEHKYYFINTGITLLIGTYIPVLPAFICYFVGCHSLYSLHVISSSLEITIGQLYRKLLPFTLLALMIGTSYITLVSQEKWLAHSFIFLSILTIPHFILMHKIIIKKPE